MYKSVWKFVRVWNSMSMYMCERECDKCLVKWVRVYRRDSVCVCVCMYACVCAICMHMCVCLCL